MARFFLCATLCCICVPGFAALLPESIKPFVSASISHDDNLFRDPNNERSDTVTGIGGGVELDLEASRQRFRALGEVVNKSFDTNDYLDTTDAYGNLRWDWRVGRLSFGTLKYDYTRGLQSFNESTGTEKDVRVSQQVFGDAYVALTTQWRLRVVGDVLDLGFDKATDLARTTKRAGLELQFRTGSETYLGLSVDRGREEFDEKEVIGSQLVSNDNDRTGFGVVGRWEPTARSSLTARWSRTEIQYDELPQRNFDGPTARLTYEWKGAGKLSWAVNGWLSTSPEIGIGEDETTSVVETTGFSVEPVWNATAKIIARARIAYEGRDYTGAAGRLVSGFQRQDELLSATVSATYRSELIRNGLDFTATYRYSDRDSNSDDLDYVFNFMQLSAMARF